MHRRQFLTFTGLGAASLALPLGSACQSPRELRRVGRALRDARATGKPLLVLVIPKDEMQLAERQAILGEYLSNADDAALADLGLCEVVCTDTAELATVVPAARETDATDEPLMLLVETSGEPSVRPIPCKGLPAVPANVWDVAPVEHEAAVRERIAAVAGRVKQAVAADRPALERRAQDARDALDSEDVTALERNLETPARLDPHLALVGAALVRLAAADSPEAHAELMARLASAVAARYVENPPPGAAWANSLGCGIEIEGASDDDAACVACGMAFVPEISQRFLYFYSADANS